MFEQRSRLLVLRVGNTHRYPLRPAIALRREIIGSINGLEPIARKRHRIEDENAQPLLLHIGRGSWVHVVMIFCTGSRSRIMHCHGEKCYYSGPIQTGIFKTSASLTVGCEKHRLQPDALPRNMVECIMMEQYQWKKTQIENHPATRKHIAARHS